MQCTVYRAGTRSQNLVTTSSQAPSDLASSPPAHGSSSASPQRTSTEDYRAISTRGTSGIRGGDGGLQGDCGVPTTSGRWTTTVRHPYALDGWPMDVDHLCTTVVVVGRLDRANEQQLPLQRDSTTSSSRRFPLHSLEYWCTPVCPPQRIPSSSLMTGAQLTALPGFSSGLTSDYQELRRLKRVAGDPQASRSHPNDLLVLLPRTLVLSPLPRVLIDPLSPLPPLSALSSFPLPSDRPRLCPRHPPASKDPSSWPSPTRLRSPRPHHSRRSKLRTLSE